MGGRFRDVIWQVARGRLILVTLLSLLVAASEGLGFVLLVPLLQGLDDGTSVLLGLSLPLGLLLTGFVALVAVRSGAELLRSLQAQALTVQVVDGLRSRALTALVGAEWKALSRMRQSANRALLITTIDRVARSVTLLTELVRLSLALLAMTLAALAIAPAAALAGLIAALVALALQRGLRGRARSLGEALSRHYDAIYLRLEETLDALRLIKSFGREQRSLGETQTAFVDLRKSERRYLVATGLARGLFQTGAALALAGAIWLAVMRWGVAPVVLLPLAALAVRAVPMLAAFQQAAQDWSHAAPALDEAVDLIDAAERDAEPSATTPPHLKHSITLSGVSLSHAPGRTAVRTLDATIPALGIAAVTGPSGAGKSTFADLVGGLLAPDTGRILIDDVELEGGARIGWRSRVAYVQQEPVLFSGTVRDNLLWADPEAGDAALARALERAAATFVHALPGGLDCDLGSAGRALSGGERQRIALARALLRDPDLLILDEATSALDDESEQAIAHAVSALVGQCTVLVIGHRGALTALAQHRIALGRS